MTLKRIQETHALLGVGPFMLIVNMTIEKYFHFRSETTDIAFEWFCSEESVIMAFVFCKSSHELITGVNYLPTKDS